VISKFLLGILLSFDLYASIGVEIKLNNGLIIIGEYIETYEDRWFYEPPVETKEHYVLVFELISNRLDFHFFQLKEVQTVQLIPLFQQDFHSYLRSQGLILNHEVINKAVVLTGHEGHHRHEVMLGNFAWDLGILDQESSQYQNSGLALEDYYVYNRPVMSPFDGLIVALENQAVDNPPDPTFQSSLENLRPNYILMLLEYPFYFSLVHFAKESMVVQVGDQVKKGDLLGRVGNSGVSFIPHLHMTLFLYLESFERFISVPIPSDRYPSLVY
jgi:hypothetical protein